MIWVDREVKQLKERKKKLEWVDDMKTPSGRIHVGALRGVVIHDITYKVLLENDIPAKFTYVFNDLDPMDAIPSYLEYDKWEPHAGKPLYTIPSPEKGAKNFADFYAQEFIKVFESINCHPEIIWSSQLHAAGKMNDVIRIALDNREKIRNIYESVAKAKKPDNWYPFQVICETCGKIGTTVVTGWDGEKVTYECRQEMVAWAKGCGNKGIISPFNGNGKLLWRIDWPAHWKVIGVTIEGSGKDHMSSGGSYDMASHISKDVFNWEPAYALPYEWFTIGGKKMSSSKGIGTSALQVSQILPSEVLRFLIVRTPIGTHLDFNPFGDTIPNLFDDFDRCLNAYFDKLEGTIPEGKPGEVLSDFARIAELSEVKPLAEKRIFLPRFRTVVNMLKTKADMLQFFETQKGSPLNDEEKAVLEERVIYAEVYLNNYAQAEDKIELTEEIPPDFNPTDKQKVFLQQLVKNLTQKKPTDRDTIQEVVFETLKKNQFQPKEVFSAFYQVLTGKNFGPKAADLILEFGLETVVERITKAISNSPSTNEKQITQTKFSLFEDTEVFSIDQKLAEKIPSLTIGIAVIRGVTITKSNKELEKEIDDFIKTQSGLTTEMINTYPEVQSYRKLYKEMKVDWHSRRPSPEALLRRVALKKGLYHINTCVDAYNLVVMKNRVSSGAFDLDAVQFPTVLRYAKEGESIHLLGDKEPTIYKPTEIAYFDTVGGYNIDFNYRDAQRTAVSEKTKNLLINIDGVYNILQEQVEKTLQETIDSIQKYSGGTVEIAGIIKP